MNPISPIPNAPSVPKTSGLAIWSLVLGILSLMCFTILAGVPGVICGHMALSRIKKSGGALTGSGLAIGGLVTGYLGVALFVLLIPIAIPNFIRARAVAQKAVCTVNLHQIQNAKQTWASDNKKQPTDVPTAQDLAPYLPKGMPQCVAGGTYSINAVNQKPTCSIPDHKITE